MSPTSTSPVAERVYLDVPFSARGSAKALGCFFDGERKQWWITGEIALKNRKAIARWMPKFAFSTPPALRRRNDGHVCPGCGKPHGLWGPPLCWECRRN